MAFGGNDFGTSCNKMCIRDRVYPILYIDAIHYSVRDNGVIRKLAAYVILGINAEGKKEVLTISIGENESAKYWLSVLNELKNRGVKDVYKRQTMYFPLL